jgi:hypothetical protein
MSAERICKPEVIGLGSTREQDQRVTLAMHAEMRCDGRLQAEEDHLLNIGLTSRTTPDADRSRIHRRYRNDAKATSDDDFLVFVATK